MKFLALLLLVTLRSEAQAADSFLLENEVLPPIALSILPAPECLQRIAKLCGEKTLRTCGLVSAGVNPSKDTALSAAKRAAAYGEWRFRVYLRHYQRASVNPRGDSFCAEYEGEALRDKRFAEGRIGEYFPVFPLAQGNQEKLAERYGLSEAELASMSGYWGSFYREINPAMRAGNLSPKLRVFADVFNSALAKLPSYGGGPLMRNSTLDRQAVEEHGEGSVVTYAAYMSTSKECNNYSFGNHSFAIFATPATQRDFNEYTGTGEIIIPPGFHFKVITRHDLGEGRFHFVLAESDAEGKLLVRLPEELPTAPTVCP